MTTMTTAVPGFDNLDIAALSTRTGVKWARARTAGVTPAWVADMDFELAPVIRRALVDLAESGDLGYPNWGAGSPLRAEFARRMAQRYEWHIDPAAVREQTDLIQALQLVLRLSTKPGDAVVIQTPNYPPFLATLHTMGLSVTEMPFVDTDTGWRMDFDALERQLQLHRPKVMVLVNPHNPTGRVHTRAELERIAAFAAEFDLVVISDEIHAELVYAPHVHIPFASVSAEAAARTVTITSAGKSFNIAGMRCAVSHFGPSWLLERRDAEPPDLYGTVAIPGVVATLAAWRHGTLWQETLLAVLDRNRHHVQDTIRTDLPEVRHHLPEATYLSWLDVSSCGITKPVDAILHTGQVIVDGGTPFGSSGQFVRVNFATSQAILDRILNGVTSALRPA